MPLPFLFLFLLSHRANKTGNQHAEAPHRVVVMVIDQGAYHYFTRFKKDLQHGFRRLFNDGTVFCDAHHPHAAPLTATGHATLNAGCYPAEHGVIMNSWYTPEGKLVSSVEDERPEAKVHCPKKPCLCNASSRTLMVNGISDVAVESGIPVYSLSYKDRAAIGMGGHPGIGKTKALKNVFWYDEHQEAFTSNHEYCDTLPTWLEHFNAMLPKKIATAEDWSLCLAPDHHIYSTFAKQIYHVSASPEGLASTKIVPVDSSVKVFPKKNFMLAPQSNKILCDLALAALDHIDQNRSAKDQALVWISFSSLDKVGHIYGPNSLEAIDTFLHLDKIIGDFMTSIDKRYGQGKTFFVLTADHGSVPIVENLAEENYKPARRIVMHEIVASLNEKITKKFGIKKLFFGFKTNQLFWDERKLENMSTERVKKITAFVKDELYQVKGIKKIWTFDELASSNPPEGSFKYLFKNQLYKGRSGQFFCLGDPFVMLANHSSGTCHRSPYRHDRHVPLMFCQGTKMKHGTIADRVSTTQLAPTLAHALGITPCKTMIHQPLPYVD